MLKIKIKKRVPQNMKELVVEIRKVMISHIGSSNGITKMSLFRKLFGNPDKYNEMQIWWLWEKVKISMNWMRKRSNCFIASKLEVGSVYSYFVIKDFDDFGYYRERLKKNMLKMQKMISIGEKAITERRYKKFLYEEGINKQ